MGTVINICKTELNIQSAASGATVSLLRAKDSATVKITAANKEGSYSFENIPAGKYLVAVTVVGHQKAYSGLMEIGELQRTIHVPAIILIPVNKDMAGVTVTAKKTFD